MMKRPLFILLFFLLAFSGCKKAETIRTSGTDTIDNTVYQDATYYALGFSFTQAKKISNLSDPGPDLTLYLNQDNPSLPSRLTLMVNNFKNSYFKIGDFPDEASAIAAFDNLKTVGTSYQWVNIADPIKENQVWIYRTGRDLYAKFRIISTKNEMRNNLAYGECTFEWVFQPDGSSTFPGK
jgi:hypothetical protein